MSPGKIKDSVKRESKAISKEKISSPTSSAACRPKTKAAASMNWRALFTTVSPKKTNLTEAQLKAKQSSVNETNDNTTTCDQSDLLEFGSSRFVKFASLPPRILNVFGMIKYDCKANLVTPLPPNIAPHVKYPTPAVSLDCEFVDIGVTNREFHVARVSVVNEYGYLLYHTYVKPRVPISDFLTMFSGVRPEDLVNGSTLEEVQKTVSTLIKGRKLVGHSIKSDLSVLKLRHPKHMLRDTAKYFRVVYRKLPALKVLVEDFFSYKIQEGEHDPTEDAQAAMKIYLLNKTKWEELMKTHIGYLPVMYYTLKD